MTELERLYVEENYTLRQLSMTFRKSLHLIKKELRTAGVDIRTQAKPCPDVEKLRLLANDQTLGNKDIAKMFEVGTGQIHKWFIENDISRLALRNNEGRKPSVESLAKDYCDDLMSAVDMGVKYGVSNVTIQNWLKSYRIDVRGVRESFPITLEKMKATNAKRFGDEFPLRTSLLKEKSKETNMRRRGVPFPSQCPLVRAKTKKTVQDLYGVDCVFDLIDSTSHEENALISLLNYEGFSFVQSDRSILEGKELDGYDAHRKVAIEYCGLFFHNENPRNKKYTKHNHYQKWKKCQELGIKLYTIYSDEWAAFPQKIISFIKHGSGMGFSKRIYARETTCVPVSRTLAVDILRKHHLQNESRSILYAFGLEYNGYIQSLMTFGRHHRDSEKIVMNRFVTNGDVSVVGGAAKLISNAYDVIGVDEITTWSDNRWTDGNVYQKSGFVFDRNLAPDYEWSTPTQRLSKQSRRKSATGQSKELTEKEYNESLGMYRIWDCGKIRWIYSKKKGP